MKELTVQYDEYIKRLLANGRKVGQYACPSCQEPISTPLPPKGETWDSATTCPFCKNLHFKVVTHDQIKADSME